MNENAKRLLKYILILCISALFIYFILRYQKDISGMNIHRLRRYILSYGKFASLIFIIIYSLKPILLIIPASLLSILAGNIFGPIHAAILSLISCFFSGTLAFYLAKLLGKPFVDKLLRGKAMRLDSNIEEHGFKIMLLMRLSCIFPYDPLSYAAGLTRMKYRDFILGTMIGILPEMITYSYMGRNLQHPFSMRFIFPIIVLIVIAVLATFKYKASKEDGKS